MTTADIVKFFDGYNRAARIYPALITLSPAIWYVAAFAPHFAADTLKGGLAVLFLFCLLYLLGTLARARGKMVEPRLLSEWGGWPSTLLLRHADASIDPLTKSRYHAALAKMTGITFPDIDGEKSAPAESDVIYRSATRALIEARRGPEYEMLHKENASYGFRRNLYGLRPISIALGSLFTVITCSIWFIDYQGAAGPRAVWTALRREPAWLSVTVLDLCYLAFFGFIVTPAFVLQAGRDYAEALFRTLDTPAAKARRKRSA